MIAYMLLNSDYFFMKEQNYRLLKSSVMPLKFFAVIIINFLKDLTSPFGNEIIFHIMKYNDDIRIHPES